MMRDAERRSALVIRPSALCSDAVLSVGIVHLNLTSDLNVFETLDLS
jgi:hypothetical protein